MSRSPGAEVDVRDVERLRGEVRDVLRRELNRDVHLRDSRAPEGDIAHLLQALDAGSWRRDFAAALDAVFLDAWDVTAAATRKVVELARALNLKPLPAAGRPRGA